MSSGRFSGVVLFALGGVLLGLPAGAVDGVIEINQASALAGGVTPCDTAGFPVSFCASGAYRLTSNLAYPSATASAIVANAADVAIDLNGMTISGTNTCATGVDGWVTSCTQASAFAALSGDVRTVVANGRIKGASGDGIFVRDASEVRNLQVTDCARAGISVGSRSLIVDVEAVGNGSFGISGVSETRIAGAVSTNNGDLGIAVGVGSSVEGVVAARNQSHGFFLGAGSQLKGFTATQNGWSGVRAVDGSLVESGTVRDNGRAIAASCGISGAGGASYHSVVITSVSGGNSATACFAFNLGANSCQNAACPT